MNRWSVLLITLALVILVGCEDPCQLTPKQIVSNKLMEELDYCDHKYGDNSYDKYKVMNEKYCNQMLTMVDKLIKEGWFDTEDQIEIESIYKEVEQDTMPSNTSSLWDDDTETIIGTI